MTLIPFRAESRLGLLMRTFKSRQAALSAALLALCALLSAQSARAVATEKYDIILEKNAFKELDIPEPEQPAPPAEPEQPAAPSASFGQDYTLRAMIDEHGKIRVGMLDKKTNKTFYLSEGDIYEGLSLVSADYSEETAIVKRGTETHLFTMRRTDTAMASAAQPAGPKPFTLPGAAITPFPQPGPASAFRGMNIEKFMKENPDLVKQAPPSMRMPDKGFRAMGKGMTIEQFMKSHPEIVNQFPSPIQPNIPGSPSSDRGETIERFMRENSGVGPPMPQPEVSFPTPVPEAEEEVFE